MARAIRVSGIIKTNNAGLVVCRCSSLRYKCSISFRLDCRARGRGTGQIEYRTQYKTRFKIFYELEGEAMSGFSSRSTIRDVLSIIIIIIIIIVSKELYGGNYFYDYP